jgi:hypothetical protein
MAVIGRARPEYLAGMCPCTCRDDAAVMARWTADFMTWNDSHIFPVLNIEEIAPIWSESLAWTKSASS